MENDLIKNAVLFLSKLPGVGKKSAERYILHTLKHRETLLTGLINALSEMQNNIIKCANCGNMDTKSPCTICQDEKRDKKTICIVEDLAAMYVIENSGFYKGQYHVLWGLLSAFENIGPDALELPKLIEKFKKQEIEEVIIALSSNIEGQTTLHYIYDLLKEKDVKVTTLAQGVPVGGEIEYLDAGTLNTAFISRKTLEAN